MSLDGSNGRAPRVRVAVIGYGYWGPNLARNVVACSDTELRWICDLDEETLARARQLNPAVQATTSWSDILDRVDVDAVILSLPVRLHYRFALEALRAGKHVLVEKPLATTSVECDDLAAEAARSGTVLMVSHTFEYNAAVRAIHSYIREGVIGEPYYVSMRRTNLGIVRSDENAMWSLAPHDLSILCYWLQREPVSVTATGLARLQDGIEDVVFLTLRFEGDMLGHVHCSWLDPHKVREATIVGSEKMVYYDDVSTDEKIRLYDKGIVRDQSQPAELGRYGDFARFQMLARAGDVVIPKLDFREPLAVEIEHFADCIRTGATPITDVVNGRRVVRILEAADRSLASGRTESIMPTQVPAAGSA
ncbi:MAG TPA: Gfo/Idh/MocA family oxidoreductase [Solirubrobacteraceae bacterium]|nr:Gfo/Idh/MocA family oxidoreductase [Solirubrobacteraceae bacterium]